MTFLQSAAIDDGFVQTFAVSQRSQICQRSDSPLRVLFRPDTAGDRMEIVFELGRIFANDVAKSMDYTYQIKRGATIVASGSVTHHWWARWRWQSAARLVVGSLSSAVASGLLPANFRALGADAPAQAYQPMGLAGFAPDMGAAGERRDIGLITEWCAQYAAKGNNLSTVIAQGEAMAGFPWIFRDERTGRAISLTTYPNASVDDRGAPNPLILTQLINVRLEEAHMPNGLLVPYLLTGDPYYLEALQYQALWCYLSHPADAYRNFLGQTRAAAWTLASTGLALQLTPASSGWLMSKAQMHARLDAKRTRLEADRLLYPGELAAACPQVEGGVNVTAPWMDDFLTASLCWLVLMGRNEFSSLAQWRWESSRRRGMGIGMPRTYATAYRYVMAPTLAESYTKSKAAFADWRTTTGTDYAFGDWNYLSYLHGAAVIAGRLGYQDAQAVAAWTDAQLNRADAWPRTTKWALQ